MGQMFHMSTIPASWSARPVVLGRHSRSAAGRVLGRSGRWQFRGQRQPEGDTANVHPDTKATEAANLKPRWSLPRERTTRSRRDSAAEVIQRCRVVW